MIVLAVLVGVVVGFGVGWLVYPVLRRPEPRALPPPPVDYTPLLIEAMSKGMAEAAEAVGRAVQIAQFAPAEPAAVTRRVQSFDADIEAGLVDRSDPTDMGWLSPDRPDVVFEAPPGGWPSG